MTSYDRYITRTPKEWDEEPKTECCAVEIVTGEVSDYACYYCGKPVDEQGVAIEVEDVADESYAQTGGKVRLVEVLVPAFFVVAMFIFLLGLQIWENTK